jgi:hypothetical protein
MNRTVGRSTLGRTDGDVAGGASAACSLEKGKGICSTCALLASGAGLSADDSDEKILMA